MITSQFAARTGAIGERVGIGGRLAALRFVAALPAIVGSGLLLVVLSAPLIGWIPLVLAGWLAVVPALHTRAGERVAVVVGCRFRTPGRAERVALGPVWQFACAAARIDSAGLDLYLKRDRAINAYAAGRRSVAVTTGSVTALLAGRLDPGQMRALLLHELGHHATGGVRYGLATAWLAAPWRLASRVVLGLCFRLVARRQPRVLLATVVTAGVAVAVGQSVQHRHVAAAALLAAVAVCAVACPALDAWVSRRAELSADRFAAACGAGPALAAALASIDIPRVARRRGPWVLRRHPALVRRLARLACPSAAPPRARSRWPGMTEDPSGPLFR